MATNTIKQTTTRRREMSAKDEFFQTVELLENALSHLPVVDMIISKRVNRQFRDTFVGSISLQSRLRPAPASADQWHEYGLPDSLAFIVKDPTKIQQGLDLLHLSYHVTAFTPVVVNPTFFSPDPNHHQFFQLEMPIYKFKPGSSCSNMPLTNPYGTMFKVHLEHMYSSVGATYVSNPAGVTIGDIINMCQRWRGILSIRSLELQATDARIVEQEVVDEVWEKNVWRSKAEFGTVLPRIWHRVFEMLSERDAYNLSLTKRDVRRSYLHWYHGGLYRTWFV